MRSEFPPRQANSGLVEGPGLRRAASQIATLCRPDSWNEKTGPKLTAIGALKNVKKGFDRAVDRSVELGLGFCFEQRSYGGWVAGWVQTGHIPDRIDRADI
jgi:hypothetical protein